MLTSQRLSAGTAPARPHRATPTAPDPAYPAYRPFRLTVRRVLPLSPHLVRVTFHGEDLAVLGTSGLDQRVKLLVPHADGSTCDVGADDPAEVRAGTWYARWRETPEEHRNPLRTYTVRSARPERRELDVDMVVHPGGRPTGAAAAWLDRVRVGDPVVLVGPDARTPDPTVGLDYRPGRARQVLLIGDETAAPAICSILEQVPPGVRAQAFVEVPTADDILALVLPRRSRISWVARDAGCATAQGFAGVAPHGLLLGRAVRTWLGRHPDHLGSAVRSTPEQLDDVDVDTELLWDAPADPSTADVYAWVAGEAAMVRDLRRYLVRDVGMSRSAVAFMGYWRQGRAETQ